MTPSNDPRPREPIRGIGIKAARNVRAEIGYAHPTELEIEVLAFMRGAVVRSTAAKGSRANLIRMGPKGIIGVAETLSPAERRWAIAHELGHFEAHAGLSFLGLCTSSDMMSAYAASGREPEANAFAAELLMPEDLYAKKCDVAKLSWSPICALAEEFDVSVMAAALRFVQFSDERLAVICAKDGVILWTSGTREFGKRPRRGSRVPEWTEASEFFKTGKVATTPQTVSASAWIDDADDDDDMKEHVFAISRLGISMSLLWWKE